LKSFFSREESLEKANQQLSAYEQQIETLRQQLQQRDHEFEQNLSRLKSQSGGDSRTNLQENIDMIRLQRDLRDKSDELRRLQTQCTNFDSVRLVTPHHSRDFLFYSSSKTAHFK
jgi:septation ring formation regulator EzrA